MLAASRQELQRCAAACAHSLDPVEKCCIARLGTFGAGEVIEILDALGDSHSQALRHPKAMEAHLAALERKLERKERKHADSGPSELASSYSSLATDAANLFRFEEAMKWIHQAEALPLPDAALGILYQHEAQIHFCMEDYVSALHMLEHGFKLLRQSGIPLDVPKLLVHYELLAHVMRSSKQMPVGVAKAMKRRMDGLLQQLRKEGYNSSMQLPKHYVPGLVGRPWHGGCEDKDAARQMKGACKAVKEALASLQQEYATLKAADKLHQEGECIHSSRLGHWHRFEVNAISETLDSGTPPCAVDSPAACALFRRLRQEGVPVVRAPCQGKDGSHVQKGFGSSTLTADLVQRESLRQSFVKVCH